MNDAVKKEPRKDAGADLTLEQIQEIVTRAPFHKWLGLKVIAVHDDGIELKATWREEWVVNVDRRYTHGGILATLVDLGADWAMVRKLGRGVPTIDMRVDYHAIALPGDLTIKGEIVRMGELSVTQLEAAIDVLERRDERAAQRVVGNDDAIDQLEQEIGHDVVRLLALRAPMAGDLRNVYAALRIASDIERIGDYAANVAKRSIPLSMVAPVAPVGGLHQLARLAAGEVREVLAAYRDRDAERAYQVWKDDVVLDEAYTGYFRQLLTYMMEDPRNITPCTHLLFMAKNIERIGDHATNIAENVWFQVTGEQLDKQRSKRDLTSSPEITKLGE